jgi:CMP-N-acetylneuraminic acid synthetase
MIILGVIPARGGSKSVSKKNIRPILSRPLIAYTIAAASDSQKLTHYLVSTDDEEIARVAEKYNAPVPFKRPAELAADETPTLPVVQHAIQFMEASLGQPVDIVVLLQPTTPQRVAADIDAAIDKLLDTRADSVVSVCDVGAYHPARMRQIIDDRLVELPIREPREMARRQDLPPIYIRNGALYVAWRDLVMTDGSLIGRDSRPYIMPPEQSINIDTPLDFLLAQQLLREEDYAHIPNWMKPAYEPPAAPAGC